MVPTLCVGGTCREFGGFDEAFAFGHEGRFEIETHAKYTAAYSVIELDRMLTRLRLLKKRSQQGCRCSNLRSPCIKLRSSDWYDSHRNDGTALLKKRRTNSSPSSSTSTATKLRQRQADDRSAECPTPTRWSSSATCRRWNASTRNV